FVAVVAETVSGGVVAGADQVAVGVVAEGQHVLHAAAGVVPRLADQLPGVVAEDDFPAGGVGRRVAVAFQVVGVDRRAQRRGLRQHVAVGVVAVAGHVLVGVGLTGDVAVLVVGVG